MAKDDKPHEQTENQKEKAPEMDIVGAIAIIIFIVFIIFYISLYVSFRF